MQSIIIGLGHRARQGKDSFAKFIMDEFGDRYDIRRFALADRLKKEVVRREQVLCTEHGIPYESNPDRSDPLCNSIHGKQVKLLQFWGQYRRKADAFYWIKLLKQDIDVDPPQFALVSDIRYLNEMFWVRSEGGVYVKVERPGFIDPTRDANHPSEAELDGVIPDVHVEAGSVNELRTQALEFFSNLLRYLTTPFTTESFTREALDAEVTA